MWLTRKGNTFTEERSQKDPSKTPSGLGIQSEATPAPPAGFLMQYTIQYWEVKIWTRALVALSNLLASQSSSSPVLNKQEGPVQAHTSLFIMYFITSESSFVRCGWRRPFYGCVAGCLTWRSGTQAASCFTSCILVAVDPVSLHGMRNCPSITIVRAWWYLDIIRSAEAPVNRVSINVWWWSTLINQRRLVGRLPRSEE